MKTLTQPELDLQNAVRACYAADDVFTAALAKHKVNRYAPSDVPEVIQARQAYHLASEAMNEAFRACRASGSIYPILTA